MGDHFVRSHILWMFHFLRHGVLMEINLINLIERYGDDKKCRKYLEALKWQDGMICPRCSGTVISRIYDRDQFDCDNCRY
jgi:hypothetical protein